MVRLHDHRIFIFSADLRCSYDSPSLEEPIPIQYEHCLKWILPDLATLLHKSPIVVDDI